jgi:hypothetical protein
MARSCFMDRMGTHLEFVEFRRWQRGWDDSRSVARRSLCLDPRLRLRALPVFEPPVWVNDLDTLNCVVDIVRPCLGRPVRQPAHRQTVVPGAKSKEAANTFNIGHGSSQPEDNCNGMTHFFLLLLLFPQREKSREASRPER